MITFRVMSFNVRGSFVNDGENVWPARRELNVATIRQAGPDLIGLQEVQTGNWDDYRELLGEYEGELGPRYNNDEPFCHPGILWRPDRFEAVERGGFWLSRSPEQFSADWGTACIRSANWVRLVHRDSGQRLVLLNTHLDHISRHARLQGARLVTRRLAEVRRGEPAIVTADFNCDAGSATYRHFARAGYVDTFLAAGNVDRPDAFTFHAFTGQRHPDYGRIDWVLVHAAPTLVEAANFRILRDAAPPIYPSDHFPVVVDLTVQTG